MTILNPPAFPRTHESLDEPGMTLRDWFAGQLLSNPEFVWQTTETDGAAELAAYCYEMADQMLSKRASDV